MPKIKKSLRFVGVVGKRNGDRGVLKKHTPLHVDIEDAVVNKRKKYRENQKEETTLDDLQIKESSMIPRKLSSKLLGMIDRQQKESELEKNTEDKISDQLSLSEDDFNFGIESDIDSNEDAGNYGKESSQRNGENGDVRVENGYIVLDGADDDENFVHEPSTLKTLADVVLEELKKKKDSGSDIKKDEQGVDIDENSKEIPVKVQEVYTSVGEFLSHYRSGKLPKAFKIIPRLYQWEQILVLTQPEKWTPNSMFKATKLFASNLSSNQVQRFFSLVLLPNIRSEIQQKKKCHYHHYMAIKKAFFKPAAFLKGAILPLALEGTCTLRERIIFGSVIKKVSIPVLHSAAAIMRLCLVSPDDWNPTISHFIGIFLDKKYSLPSRAIDACVEHFHAFTRWDRRSSLPVVWHTALLILLQRYKYQLLSGQKSKINNILKSIFHDKIGVEIRRELNAINPTVELERQHSFLSLSSTKND